MGCGEGLNGEDMPGHQCQSLKAPVGSTMPTVWGRALGLQLGEARQEQQQPRERLRAQRPWGELGNRTCKGRGVGGLLSGAQRSGGPPLA